MAGARQLLLTMLGLCAVGCHQVDIVAQPVDAVVAMDAEPPPPDAQPDAQPPDAAVCVPIDWAESAAEPAALADALAAARARALCTCAGAVTAAPLITRASGDEPADVGMNAELSLNASSMIAGSLDVGGVSGLNLGNDVRLDVAGDLRVGGPLQGGFARVAVQGDVAVAGRIDLLGLTIAGDLVQPAGASLDVAEPADIAGEQRAAQVVVSPPCACGPGELVDVAALVRDRMPSGAGAGGAGCDAGVALPAGAALFVPEDLQQDADLVLALDAPSRLALLIEGNVRVDGRLVLGSESSTVDLLVGGSGTIDLPSGGELHGVLYAPEAELVLGAPLTIHGAMFVERVAATSENAELTVIR